MNFQGLHCYLIGDSLSMPGKTPGQVFAGWVHSAGGTCPVDAKGGHAISYWRPKLGNNSHRLTALLMSKRAASSGASVVFALLGTNDYAQSQANIRAGLIALNQSVGGKLYLLGPPAFEANLREGKVNAGAENVYRIAHQILGSARVLDTRPLSTDLVRAPYRSSDGVHFTGRGAEAYGGRIFHALQGREGATPRKKSEAATSLLVTGAKVFVAVKVIQVLLRRFL